MGELQVVIFGLNGQTFGADASQVFQIIRYQQVAKMPGLPGFMEGVLNYRGAVLPVISLNKRFELGDDSIGKKTKIIISKIGEKLAGFIVNDVVEIARFAEEDVEPAPLPAKSGARRFIKEVAKRDGQIVTVIDLDKVLEDAEISSLSVQAPEQRE